VTTTLPDGDQQIPSRLTVRRNSCNTPRPYQKLTTAANLSEVFTNAKDCGLTIGGDCALVHLHLLPQWEK